MSIYGSVIKSSVWPAVQNYGYLYFKTKMDMASIMFEPHPPNFENLYNFWDVEMIFRLSLLVFFKIPKIVLSEDPLYWFQRSVWECSVHSCSPWVRRLDQNWNKDVILTMRTAHVGSYFSVHFYKKYLMSEAMFLFKITTVNYPSNIIASGPMV